jgi:hypothetical protein
MTVKYHLNTQRTVTHPPLHLPVAGSPLSRDPSDRVVTDLVSKLLVSDADYYQLEETLHVPDFYPMSGISHLTMDHKRASKLAGIMKRFLEEDTSTDYSNWSNVLALSFSSSATQPMTHMSKSFISPTDISTETFFAGLLLDIGNTELSVIRDSQKWLVEARAAARNGEMRSAYRGVFRGLDILLTNAKWQQVCSELSEICSDKYPSEFGIGALRFVSGASDRIPNWNLIVHQLENIIEKRGGDVKKTMRGLKYDHGTS